MIVQATVEKVICDTCKVADGKLKCEVCKGDACVECGKAGKKFTVKTEGGDWVRDVYYCQACAGAAEVRNSGLFKALRVVVQVGKMAEADAVEWAEEVKKARAEVLAQLGLHG